MSKPRSPLQQRFPPPPPPRLETSPETPPLVRKPKSQASSSRSKAKKDSSFPISPPLNTIARETWEEVQFNESMLSSPWETSSHFHDSALEISKSLNIQSVDTQSVNSFVDSIKEDTSIAMSTLINNLQQSKRGEEGHMESIVHILEKNKEVLQSADQIFKVAQQIAKNNASMISCENGYDDESFCSSSINVMEKKPVPVTISNRKSFQPPPPPPPPTFKSSDQKKQKKKQDTGNVGSMKRGESFRSSMTSDATDSVLVMADRLAKASVIDEPAIIQGTDDTDIEYARVTQKCNNEKPGGRVYKQIAVGTDLFDENGINRTEPSLDRRAKERESDDLMKQNHKEMKKARSRRQRRRSSRKPSKLPQGTTERLIKKKKTQVSMVSNTTESTSQSTPSLLGQQINVSVRSSKSIGSNHSMRRDDDSKKSSRSQASRASSRKSSFSRKSRTSRASSSYDDESLESGNDIGDNPRPIFVLPAPSIDEISVCASSLLCRSGGAASESGVSSMSCPSRTRQFSDEKSSSWMNKIKSRLKKFKKKRPHHFDVR